MKELNQENVLQLGDNLSFASVESYNLLRTNLTYTLPIKETSKILAVSSPCPSEGKSFTTMNLAFSFAKDGLKVIVVDCDMRKPTIAKKLDIPLEPGLSNLLSSKDVDPVRKGILHENLDILTAGGYPPNPSELLGSNRMKEILDDLSTKYDYIILDLPPVNTVADPMVISKFTDGILLVVRHKHSHKKEIIRAVRQIQLVKGHLIGVVYNGYRKGSTYYKKGKGYYKSGYGYYETKDKDVNN